MSELSDLAYQIDPARWVRNVLGVEPAPWQEQFLRAPRGATILALTARQAGKTTAATWAIAHYMLFTPGSLSVIACPAQRQSGEAVRRVREILLKIGVELKSDHVYGLELKNGSRVLALPGSEDSIRGLTVDGLIVADEAARLPEAIFASLRPMRARRLQARFVMLSTAWSYTDPFWTAWADDDPSSLRLKATADIPGLFSAEFLEQERRALGEDVFNREYFGIPGGGAASPFSWDLYERATHPHAPLVPPGRAYARRTPMRRWYRPAGPLVRRSMTSTSGLVSGHRSLPMMSAAAAIARLRSSAATVRTGNTCSEFATSKSCRRVCLEAPGRARWRRLTAVTVRIR